VFEAQPYLFQSITETLRADPAERSSDTTFSEVSVFSLLGADEAVLGFAFPTQ